MGLRNQSGVARDLFPACPKAEVDGKGGVRPQFGVLTRPVLRAGDCKATLWKASKDSVTTGLLEKLSISERLFDSMSVERRERCDLSSNNIGRLRKCLLPDA